MANPNQPSEGSDINSPGENLFYLSGNNDSIKEEESSLFSMETSNLSSQSNLGEVAEENKGKAQEAKVCIAEKRSALRSSEGDFNQRDCE